MRRKNALGVTEVAHLRTNKKLYDENYDRIFNKGKKDDDADSGLDSIRSDDREGSESSSTDGSSELSNDSGDSKESNEV